MKLSLMELISKFRELNIRNKVIIVFSMVLILLFLINNVLFYEKQAEEGNNDVNNFAVKIQKCIPQNRTIYSSFSGTVNPLHRTGLISRVSGKVMAIYVSDGEKVQEDTTVLKIEDYDRIEQIERAQAMLKQREIEYDSSTKLNQKGYKAQIQVEAAFAALQGAKADLKRLELDLENTTIKSPIDGYIDKINVSTGDFVNAGQKIADVMNFEQVLVVLYVSESEVSKITLNSIAKINLLDGREVNGEVSFISKIAEQKTGSYRVEVKVTDNEMISLQGLTARVKLPSGEKFAYKVPSSALSLNDEGSLGIKIADDDNYIAFVPVEVVDHDSNGVWVVADNEDKSIRLITLGHLFVKPGDQI
ncbi:efflux RND transporter periplasmic adaptor subunit [Wolbachia endosymbiont of Ctenocephalides felis wCfeT]|uniref:efflux RND transporter periplasmic adaptor subunit n=1 Tax=Wolbachia endosymbiont of Ctenocephalides felis wCfeT TaxID=2732593 RepID=UPI0014483DB9|nr:efflux RND transporter periplasmic adaptor subunit [Wolbachia endosymbiont of Ctenocephalides felis wCfeT]